MEFSDKYSFLSNTYSCKVHYDGEVFPCVETAYQYAKCANECDHELFINRRGFWVQGYTAKDIGRKVQLREDWDQYRVDVMYQLLEDKFYHNEGLRQALCDTGDEYIAAEGDEFWGVHNGKGYNMFGKIIMEIRQNIQKMDRKKNVIVAGSRGFKDYDLLKKQLEYFFSSMTPTIVCGEARGADALGRKYAEENKLHILSYPANWEKDGRAAGYLRNEKMAKVADCLVAFWDGKSSGTKHMIETMKKLGKPVRIVKYE